MNPKPFSRYLEISRTGIDPRLFSDEMFYYYNLPDFDSSKKPSLTLGKHIDSSKFLIRDESLLISKLNPRIPRVWRVQNDKRFRSVSSTEFINIIAKECADLDFLYYFFQSVDVFKFFEAEAVGTTNSHVRFKPELIFKIENNLPPKPTQIKIARFLSTIDVAIEKTHSLIAKYLAIKQGMMQDLFTRGVDINGELRPSYEEAPDLYKSSEWGWIPKEWKVVKTESMCSDIIDCPHSTPNYIRDGIPCIRTADMIPCCLLLDQAFCISLDDYHVRIIRLEPKKGDIIYSREGERLGIASIVGDSKVCLGQRVMLLRPATYTDCNFLVWAMNHWAFYQQAFIRIGATTSPHINVADIKQFKIVRPEFKEQIRIGSRLNAVLSCIQAEENTVKKLLNLKTGLMQDLLTGKVRVKVDASTESTQYVGVHQS